jgi:hypothetical protein
MISAYLNLSLLALRDGQVALERSQFVDPLDISSWYRLLNFSLLGVRDGQIALEGGQFVHPWDISSWCRRLLMLINSNVPFSHGSHLSMSDAPFCTLS